MIPVTISAPPGIEDLALRRSSATGLPPSSAIASGGQGPAQLSRAPSIVIVVPEKKSPAGEAR